MFDYESGTLMVHATPRWYRREHLRAGRVGAAIEIFRQHLGEDLRSLLLSEDDIVIELSVRKGASVSELTEKLQGIVREHVEPLDGVTVCWTTQADIGVRPISESAPAAWRDSVPCSERLPPEQKTVLFFAPDESSELKGISGWRRGIYDEYFRVWVDDKSTVGDNLIYWELDQVTHWQELPPDPRSEAGETSESKPVPSPTAALTCGVRECGGKAVARTSSGVPICANCLTACGLSSSAVELAVSLNADVPLRSTPHLEALRARLAPLISSNGVLSPLARIFDDFLAGGAS